MCMWKRAPADDLITVPLHKRSLGFTHVRVNLLIMNDQMKIDNTLDMFLNCTCTKPIHVAI